MRVLALIVLCILGCSNPHNQKLPTDIKAWPDDTALKKAIEKLPESDRQTLAAYAMRQGMAGLFGVTQIPEGTTIQQALDQQRKWQADQEKSEAEGKALAAQVSAQREEQQRRMNEILAVAVSSLRFVESDYRSNRYSDEFHIEILFKNKSDRDLRGVKGAVRFRDMFGTEIKTIGVAYDEGIGAGKQNFGSLDYNQFRDADRRLASKTLDKLKVEWIPEMYLFEDGTSLTVPTN